MNSLSTYSENPDLIACWIEAGPDPLHPFMKRENACWQEDKKLTRIA
jgi:hypothetical protein